MSESNSFRDQWYVVQVLSGQEGKVRDRIARTAEAEGNAAAVAEMNEQIEESKVHAAQFKATLEKAQKRFAALTNVEERHAKHYQTRLAAIQG